MSVECFSRAILQMRSWEGPRLKVLKLSLYGEPLANLNFCEMLRIAKNGAKILITDETEKLRERYNNNKFYKANKITNPANYLPGYCKEVEYKEICNGDLYVLTFRKP